MFISIRSPKLEDWRGWQAGLACYTAGALLALAFAPFFYWPVIFFSLCAFYLLLAGATGLRSAALRGFGFGYGFLMAGTWWIANALLVDVAKFGWLIPICVFGLSAVFALWFMLFGALAYKLCQAARLWVNVMRFAALWVAVEYLRSIGIFGFPWNLMGYTALASIYTAQLGSVIGTFGLSFLVVLAGVLPVLSLRSDTGCSWMKGIALPVLMIGAMVAYGVVRLPHDSAMTETRLSVVQPDIPQAIKSAREGQQQAIEILGTLSRAHPVEGVQDITVWPETAYPFALRDDRADMYPPSGLLVTGALRIEGADATLKIFNSLVAIDHQGVVRMQYDKSQLVPFGEFVPLRSVLPLEKITPGSLDFSRGHGPQTFTVDDAPAFSPLICYEVIFPWDAVDAGHRPAWMVNTTNDGWYGVSPGPFQHFSMARMRAIEQGLPLVRAANSGISGVIDPYGRVTAMLPLNARGAISALLPAPLPPTLYARVGEWPILTIVFFLLVRGMLAVLRKRNK